MEKRFVATVIAGIMAISIMGCGAKATEPTDPVAQKVISDINALGDITIEDEAAINQLIATYATLTDSQKSQVSNYINLLNAQEKLTEIKNQVSESTMIGRNYYSFVAKAISSLKSNLKNPSSLEIYGIIINSAELYDSEGKVSDMSQTGAICVTIGYTATNSYGSAMDGTFAYQWTSVSASNHGFVDRSNIIKYSDKENIILGNSNVYEKYDVEGIFIYNDMDYLRSSADRGKSGWADFDKQYNDCMGEIDYWNTLSKTFTFAISLDDFVGQGYSLK